MRPRLEFKVENGKIWSRTIPKEIRKNIGTCPYCGVSVFVSGGQALTFTNGKPTHKRCRK